MNANHIFLTELIAQWILYKERKMAEPKTDKSAKIVQHPAVLG